ncbi:Mu-like prophage protein gpG [Prevotella dentalis DSM 3688]|uniref:Mu-like prophage protein gpG n=1 Tax=Prevotella dentalis (strain ATCC 49559 / DSM 3688 / JCM 13448 / NCTC 12043 / ES 2772) TaxID=908937 RepID=F9D7A0_PREDD|nr:phage virion morphogenesis protein [Prevotella dentalis]AGB29738.1 Mu-like prophage protein gpG [Prevotella dentalis DSM 3688]AGB29831.1 Mu-like prophage protein gpG [Prevotella dentalis DSM 3688]EGQ11466.1 hypothetical protein HMPREF9136_2728 [Prevotella dentalis DSM 3688]
MADFDIEKFKRTVLTDIAVELKDEFNENFSRKAFFGKKWRPRKDTKANGSLLVVHGHLRSSISTHISEDGIHFTSSMPYASVHNEGVKGTQSVKAHSRKGKPVRAHTRHANIPQRQFVGDGKDTRHIIKECLDRSAKEFDMELTKLLRQK